MMLILLRALGWALAGLAYALFVVVLLPLVLIVGAFLLLTPPGWFFLPSAILVATVAIIVGQRNRRRRQAMIAMTYLQSAVRMNQPLPAVALAASLSERGGLSNGFAALHHRLGQGESLAHALQWSFAQAPRRWIGMLDAGEQLGRLPQVFARLVRQERDRQAEALNSARSDFYYPLFCLTGIGTLVMLFMLFIEPKFEEIFMDFGSQLPPVTMSLIGFTRWLSGRQYPEQMIPGALLIFMGLLVLLLAFILVRSARTGRALVDTLVWHAPLVRSVARSRGYADACHLIAQALGAGLPLDVAIQSAADGQPNAALGLVLENWRHQVWGGQPAADAARQCGVPSMIWGMLGAAQGATGMSDVFDFLARYYEQRFVRLQAFVKATVPVIVVLGLAVVVAWVVLSLFLPLVVLIQDQADVVFSW